MKRSCLILIIVIAALILGGIIVEFFLQNKEILPPIIEVFLPEQRFRSYLELPSYSGKFLEFNEAKSEITIIYFNTETMKVNQETFKMDKETIFSKMTLSPYQPNLFPKGELKKIKQEAQTTVFYLTVEDGIPLARLIRVEALF